MPMPNDAALIRQLAQQALDLKRITDIRNTTATSAQVIETVYTAELAAQAELATTAVRLGAPLAETTTSYGGTTASGAGTAIGWPAILAVGASPLLNQLQPGQPCSHLDLHQ